MNWLDLWAHIKVIEDAIGVGICLLIILLYVIAVVWDKVDNWKLKRRMRKDESK